MSDKEIIVAENSPHLNKETTAIMYSGKFFPCLNMTIRDAIHGGYQMGKLEDGTTWKRGW